MAYPSLWPPTNLSPLGYFVYFILDPNTYLAYLFHKGQQLLK